MAVTFAFAFNIADISYKHCGLAIARWFRTVEIDQEYLSHLYFSAVNRPRWKAEISWVASTHTLRVPLAIIANIWIEPDVDTSRILLSFFRFSLFAPSCTADLRDLNWLAFFCPPGQTN